ncbi:unnamed protein product, partial [Medioppia subpectinata]
MNYDQGLIGWAVCQPQLAPTKCVDNGQCKQIDPTQLNVHLVPHTHDDVGWLKTVDQYFYGTRNGDQRAGVQYIIDSVVEQLLKNETRKFIYVETAFFWKWWQLQTPEHQERVKKLVNDGQLEFINGGWCMNDEAAAHYQSIVDQMTWGHRRLQDTFGQLEFINGGWCMNDEAAAHYQSIVDQMTWGHRRLQDTFGECGIPRIGWQIDPFGHSREQASLFAQMAFDAVFFYRIDYEDHNIRVKEKRMELLWQGSDDLGKASDIFTHIMEMGYGPPPGFNWETARDNPSDDAIIDDPESEDYNVDKIVDKFITYAKQYSNYYSTNNVLFPMGTDFCYEDANAWFKNMDKLIKYVNARKVNGSNVNVFYSTPTCYLNGIHQANHTFTTKSDDFFPYASYYHSYWTGYFTSRPALKRYEKVGNNALQVCKQLDVLSLGNGKNEDKITPLREWLGVMQHHDAIAGTEKQHVSDNYALKLYKTIEKCQSVVDESLNILIGDKNLNQLFCNQLNVSACAVTEGTDNIAVTLYNAFGHNVNHVVRLPVTSKAYKVFDPKGNAVKSNIVAIPESVLSLKERKSKAKLLNHKLRVHGPKDNNDDFHQPSGAYVFRSDGDSPQLYNTTTLQADLIETCLHFLQAPKEIISRWETNLTTNGLFYTDANGRQLLERKRDFRPTWKLTVYEEIAGNYYPVNSRIAIRDEKQDIQMTVLNDRSQGGSSIKDGSVELMVHRRDLYDDHFGVAEALNEPGVDGKGLQIRGKFWVLFTSIAEAAEAHREMAYDILLEPSFTFAKYSGSPEEYVKSHKTQYSGLTKELPKNVHLLTLEQWK